MSAIRYHVRHDTVYRYERPVGESHQLLRLAPRELPYQRCLAHRVHVDPVPARSGTFVDSFGNTINVLHFEARHHKLSIRSENWVELHPRPSRLLAASASVHDTHQALGYRAGKRMAPETLTATMFLFESTFVRLKRDFADYAADLFLPDTPLLVAVDGLMRRLFADFTFDREATENSTPVTEVFIARRGVCQDFAHLMISCLRSLGIAARYVSGYLLTRPPAGKKRLIGADATHAWVSVFCPGEGWVDFDPTNAVLPALEHITIGWGRDFSDISPVHGVILGGGGHEPEIAVTVLPEDEFAALNADHDRPVLDLTSSAP